MAFLQGDLRMSKVGGASEPLQLSWRGEWAATEAAFDDEDGLVSGFTYTLERKVEAAPAAAAAAPAAAPAPAAPAEGGEKVPPSAASIAGTWLGSGGFAIKGDEGEMSMIAEADMECTIVAEGADVSFTAKGTNVYGEFELTGSVDDEFTLTCTKAYVGGDDGSSDDSEVRDYFII